MNPMVYMIQSREKELEQQLERRNTPRGIVVSWVEEKLRRVVPSLWSNLRPAANPPHTPCETC